VGILGKKMLGKIKKEFDPKNIFAVGNLGVE
jgi:FAD/FMN-containing dehydrogenase